MAGKVCGKAAHRVRTSGDRRKLSKLQAYVRHNDGNEKADKGLLEQIKGAIRQLSGGDDG